MGNYNYIEQTGVIIPDTSDSKTEVEDEFRSIFGQDFVTDDETPEGAWINSEVTSRQSVARNNANLANQINPNLSGGIFLDSILALTGDERTGAQRSTVQAVISGIPNTLIPIGTRVDTTDGAQFELTRAAIIETMGSVTASFSSVEAGPVEAAAGTLTVVVSGAPLGMESVTNAAPATLGRLLQSDPSARNSRRNKLGLQGRSLALAVSSNIRDVPGVRSLAFRENFESTTRVIDGITLVANSTWVAVDGGADQAIAAAYQRAKTGGANFNGAQSEVVTDPTSGQDITVRFDRPDARAMIIRATVRGRSSVSNPNDAVRDAIISYSQGNQINDEGFVIGADVSPYELSVAVGIDVAGLFVTRMEVALKSDGNTTYTTNTFPIALDEIATIIRADIEVVVQ